MTNRDESVPTIWWKFKEVLQRTWESDWKIIIRWIKSWWKLWKIYSYTVLTSYWWMEWKDWPFEKVQLISIYDRRNRRKNKIKNKASLWQGMWRVKRAGGILIKVNYFIYPPVATLLPPCQRGTWNLITVYNYSWELTYNPYNDVLDAEIFWFI